MTRKCHTAVARVNEVGRQSAMDLNMFEYIFDSEIFDYWTLMELTNLNYAGMDR